MNRLLRSVALAALLLLSMTIPALAEGTLVEEDAPVPEEFVVNAYSAILLNMDTGQVLYEYEADDINPPASTTKIMTALLCLEHGDPKDVITVSDVIYTVSDQASKGNLVVGEVMTIHQVLQQMLVVSASEATVVVAEYVAGDVETFVDMMNAKAEELGCTNTHFTNTHGLPNSEHYTSARDLSKIAMAAMEYEEFRDIVSQAVTTVAPTNVHGTQTIISTNGILPGSQYPEYDYPYAIGIKTGHNSTSGYCLVSAADKDGLRLLCVVMGTPSRLSSFQQSIDLYEWGYENYDIITYGQEPLSEPGLPDMNEKDPEPEENVILLEETTPSPIPSTRPVPAPSPSPSQEAALAPTAEVSPSPALSPLEGLRAALDAPGTGTMLVFIGIVLLGTIVLLIVAVVALIRGRRR